MTAWRLRSTEKAGLSTRPLTSLRWNANPRLLAENQDDERAWHHGWPRVRIIGGGRGRGAEIGGDEVNVVRLLVERHGAFPTLRGHVFDHGVLVGRILVDHGQRAVAVRAEGHLR